jgi:hypothetical protein
MAASLMAVYYAVQQQRVLGRLLEPEQVRRWIRGPVWAESQRTQWKKKSKRNLACEPDAFHPDDGASEDDLRLSMMQRCYKPAVSSVLTVSAPHLLLSTSILGLLLSMAIYLGFVWTKDLDEKVAGKHDSRNVFILFIASWGVCWLVYALSDAAEEEDLPLEYGVLQQNVNAWLLMNHQTVKEWGYEIHDIGNGNARIRAAGEKWQSLSTEQPTD